MEAGKKRNKNRLQRKSDHVTGKTVVRQISHNAKRWSFTLHRKFNTSCKP